MSARLVYRIAAGLLVLFAVGHTLGFSQADPKWGLEPLLAMLRATSFEADGFRRSWWDFYLAVGWISGLFYLFAAVLAWQLGGLPAAMLARLRLTAWAFPVAFAAVAGISVLKLFLIPIAFAGVITLTLALAAWLAASPPVADGAQAAP